MLMPLMGFTFMLIIVGALASLVAIGDPQYARRAPFIGFPSLLAGLGALSLCFVLGFLGMVLDHATELPIFSGLGFLFGYGVGGLGGAVAGLILASRHIRKANS
ncbi:MAG: hypothetical protein LC803_14705 [Acidobacteria bacterium]|nr:hypothetical protein [Acidobacteriota bacterium]